MRERPILFNGTMVRAILAGTKTQTRRPIKPRVPWHHLEIDDDSGTRIPMVDREPDVIGGNWEPLACPFGEVGDALWVRETWAVGACASGFSPLELHAGTWLHDNGGCWYRADDAAPPSPISPRGQWRPSIHMPRWASRLTLLVTEVRVERLQDISESDACADGGFSRITRDCKVPKFAELWDGAYGAGAWDANPWVFAISFERNERT